MSEDIVKRLQACAPTFGHIRLMGDTKYLINPDGPEAADEITRLRSALKEREEALALWLAYDEQDEADFAQAGPMLFYAKAIEATRAVMGASQPFRDDLAFNDDPRSLEEIAARALKEQR